jgi:DNA-nicking Smr family endonuclease
MQRVEGWPQPHHETLPETKSPRDPAKRGSSLNTEHSILGAMDDPIQFPITGVLDLHTFKPNEVKDLVPDYLAACHEKGIFQVRIIHGKGIGNLRRSVHAILGKHPLVSFFTLDHPEYGGWGATIVHLKRE